MLQTKLKSSSSVNAKKSGDKSVPGTPRKSVVAFAVLSKGSEHQTPRSNRSSKIQVSSRRLTSTRLTSSRLTVSRRSRSRSRYSIHDHSDCSVSPRKITYLPTYRMESQRPINTEHITFIIRNSVLAAVNDPMMSTYDAVRAMKCCKDLTFDIRFRIKLLRYDRYRIIVIVNIFEQRHQSTHWQMGFMWDIQADQWLSFQHDTKSYTITAVVLAVYWE